MFIICYNFVISEIMGSYKTQIWRQRRRINRSLANCMQSWRLGNKCEYTWTAGVVLQTSPLSVEDNVVNKITLGTTVETNNEILYFMEKKLKVIHCYAKIIEKKRQGKNIAVGLKHLLKSCVMLNDG